MLVVKKIEPWGVSHQQRWHAEALQWYGEKVIIRHRWNIEDFAAGRVDRCLVCSAGVKLNERQRVRIIGASSGSFILTFAGQNTTSLPWDASQTEIKDALEALSTLSTGDVYVTGEDIESTGLIVEFRGNWANRDIPLMTATSISLSAGATTEVLQIQAGSDASSVSARVAKVYKQAGDSWCNSCFGIGFDGGFEPIIYVSFAMIADQQEETTRSQSGVYNAANPQAQFSYDPKVEEFDLVARVSRWDTDGITPLAVQGRYVLGAVQPVTLRTGPGTPDRTLALMPENLATPWQMPDRQWVVGQTCQIQVLPPSHAWNLVPLSREDERLLELGLTPERREWYQQMTTDMPLDTGLTTP